MQSSGKSSATVGAFLALSLVWGASFLFIKVGLGGLSPAQVVLGRILFGAAALAVIMLVTRRRWPRELRVWAHLAVVGTTFCVIPFSLFAGAEQVLPSSLASIYNATTPIMTLLLTPLVLRTERLDRARIAGLAIGIAGVVVLSGPWRLIGDADLSTTLPAQLACLGATLSYGFSGLYLRRFVSGLPYDAVTLASAQLAMAALVSLLLAPFLAGGPVALSPAVVLSVTALGVLGTGVAYIWYTRVIREWGPVRASTVTYLTPVVGVVLGVLLLGEHVHWFEPVGGAIVILGILTSQGMLHRRLARPLPPATPAAKGPGEPVAR